MTWDELRRFLGIAFVTFAWLVITGGLPIPEGLDQLTAGLCILATLIYFNGPQWQAKTKKED